jgi:serine/threonine protein kinase
MLEAVHQVHTNKIIHADLKPSNFLLVGCQLKAVLRIRDVLSRIRLLLHPRSRIRGVKKHRIPDPTYFLYRYKGY